MSQNPTNEVTLTLRNMSDIEVQYRPHVELARLVNCDILMARTVNTEADNLYIATKEKLVEQQNMDNRNNEEITRLNVALTHLNNVRNISQHRITELDD